jgi:hypothetical protein
MGQCLLRKTACVTRLTQIASEDLLYVHIRETSLSGISRRSMFNNQIRMFILLSFLRTGIVRSRAILSGLHQHYVRVDNCKQTKVNPPVKEEAH